MSNLLKVFEELNSLDESISTNILYHRTTPNSAANILNENILRVGGTYIFNVEFGKCICFSRDYTFIKNMPGKNYVIFVFDRDALRSRYKLEPITDYKNTGNFSGRYINNSKAEEICFKDITNIQKYLLKIIISDELFDKFIEVLDNHNVEYNKNICVKISEYNVKNLD
jgi:hypothetical protein